MKAYRCISAFSYVKAKICLWIYRWYFTIYSLVVKYYPQHTSRCVLEYSVIRLTISLYSWNVSKSKCWMYFVVPPGVIKTSTCSFNFMWSSASTRHANISKMRRLFSLRTDFFLRFEIKFSQLLWYFFWYWFGFVRRWDTEAVVDILPLVTPNMHSAAAVLIGIVILWILFPATRNFQRCHS